MGTVNSHCCVCNKKSVKNSEFLLEEPAGKNPSVVKIQSAFRGFMFRKFNPELTANMLVKRTNSTSSQNLSKQIKEVDINYNTESFDTNAKIMRIKALLPKFQLDERETYMLKTSKLRSTALLYPDGSVYKGTINDKWQREGFGKFYLPDGSIYEGFFKDDKMQGRGRLLNIEGYVYDGEFYNRLATGYGKYVGLDGTVYKGNWEKDKQNGIGEETYSDNSHYIGNFVNGKKNGKGKFIFPDGNSYEGDFLNNELKGEGVYKFKDGRVYIGQWEGNRFNGYGVFYWPDKKRYIGHYFNNNKDGLGMFIWADGKKFEGCWKRGEQHGFGYIEINGVKEYGEWYEGKHIRSIKDDASRMNAEKAIEDLKKDPEYIKFSEKIPKYEKEIQIE